MPHRSSYLNVYGEEATELLTLKALGKLSKKYGSDIYFGSDLVCMEMCKDIESPSVTISKIIAKRFLEKLYEKNKIDRIKVMTDWRRNRTSERYRLK